MIVLFQVLVALSILLPIIAVLLMLITLPLQIVNIIRGGQPMEYAEKKRANEVVMLYPMEKE